MSQLKQYPDNGYEIDYDFNNPALCKVNGVIYSYCTQCGTYIGWETDTNWYKLIKQECCPSCREKIIREQTAIRQKNFRKRNREEKRLVKQQNTLLKQENKLLREAVMALRDDVERLKAHQERAC